ncbi:MAG: peptidylprolyl isomerase [Myxococcota bacterium]
MIEGIMLCALLGAPEERGELVDRIAAVVNEDVITLSEVSEAAEAAQPGPLSERKRERLFKDILDTLISERLIEQEIQSSDIEVTEQDVDRAVQDVLQQNEITENDLRQILASRGMAMSQYRRDLGQQLKRLKLVDMNVRVKVNVSEKEIREEYERRVRQEGQKPFVEISHFLFTGEDAAEKAREARARVVGGEAFEKVAQSVSEGPTAAQGGSLGRLDLAGLLPELARAVEGLEPGQLSAPVPTPNGVHVLRLDGRGFEASTPYEQLAPRIREELFQKQLQQKMQIWVEELEAQANVDRRL